MNFDTLLAQHARQAPERTAFQDKDHAISYAALAAEVDRLAAVMHGAGARRGERLALWMPNCIEWLVTFLACAKLGITVVAVNTRFKEHEVSQLVQRGRCSWLAMWPAFKGLPFVEILSRVDPAALGGLRGVIVVGDCAQVQAALPAAQLLPFTALPAQPLPATADLGREEDGALVYTTSGTTSAPKLVLHRQAGLIAHGALAAVAYGVSAASVVLLAAPMCGAFGFSTAITGLAVGATLVSLPVFDAAYTVHQIRAHGVTHTFANNELLDLLLRMVPGETHPFPSLQYVGFASFAPSLDDLPERALQAHIPIAGLYGSSELQALVAGHELTSEWQHRRMAGGSVIAPDGRVRAIDADTGAVLEDGQVGHIEIKAPSIMAEYLENPEATRQAFTADGYFRTGDFGYTVGPRMFVYQGRSGDHLRLGGFLVSPREIESFIEGVDGVRSAQVISSQTNGKLVPIAFVIRSENSAVDEAAVILACTQGMAKFKVPERVVFVDAFPYVQSANSNKIQRHVLEKMAQDLLKVSEVS